jgi:hypothetical protein
MNTRKHGDANIQADCEKYRAGKSCDDYVIKLY